MKNFKGYILMAAGFSVLVAVVSGITAGPAIAAAVKAALVQNVDEPARNSYSMAQNAGGACTVNCVLQINFPAVAAGSRLRIKNISVRALMGPGDKLYAAELFACPTVSCATPPFGAPIIYIPMTLQAASGVVDTLIATPVYDIWVSNQPVDFYVAPGNYPEIVVTTGFETTSANINATIDGYTISLP